MRFQQYVKEYKDDKVHVSRFNAITEDNIKSLLEEQPEYLKSFDIMMKNQSWIYRGNRNINGDYFTFSKSNTQRMSQNTKNYYILL